MQAELKRKNIVTALSSNDDDEKINDDALSLIIFALGDSLLCAIQNWIAAEDASDKLQPGYAKNALIKMLRVLHS